MPSGSNAVVSSGRRRQMVWCRFRRPGLATCSRGSTGATRNVPGDRLRQGDSPGVPRGPQSRSDVLFSEAWLNRMISKPSRRHWRKPRPVHGLQKPSLPTGVRAYLSTGVAAEARVSSTDALIASLKLQIEKLRLLWIAVDRRRDVVGQVDDHLGGMIGSRRLAAEDFLRARSSPQWGCPGFRWRALRLQECSGAGAYVHGCA